MPFQKGNKHSRGKPKGALSKRTLSFQDVLAKNNFNAAQAMVDCYVEAKKCYAMALLKEAESDPMVSNVPQYLKIAAQLAEKIASYSYPKLASIETTDPVMTEIIERIKQLKDLPKTELLRIAEAKLIEAKSDIEVKVESKNDG